MHEKIDHQRFEKIFELQDYAIEMRYPDEFIDLSDDDIDSAIRIAREFRSFILSKAGLTLPFDYPESTQFNDHQ